MEVEEGVGVCVADRAGDPGQAGFGSPYLSSGFMRIPEFSLLPRVVLSFIIKMFINECLQDFRNPR
jgi:hypothetical protein